MYARSWATSIVATDLPRDFLFFDPGGRPRRFAFLAMGCLVDSGSCAYRPVIWALSCRAIKKARLGLASRALGFPLGGMRKRKAKRRPCALQTPLSATIRRSARAIPRWTDTCAA